MVNLYPEDADDRRFLDAVARIVDVVPRDIRDLWVIRVDNWFDHKWLHFSGMGRIPFEDPRSSHPGVSLDEFSQDKLTFPPFSPRRILRQDIWTYAENAGATALVHRRVLQHSASNLHRRVADFSQSMAAIWFSSRSEDNRHGSVMGAGPTLQCVKRPNLWFATPADG
jgi:hypothetical protein